MGFYENIKNNVNSIRNAVLGKDVRDSIANAIENMNEKTEDVATGYKALLNAWLEIRNSPNLSFTEVIEARTDKNNKTFTSLKQRIDALENEEQTDVDKIFTSNHTYSKNNKTVSIDGEGVKIGNNIFTQEQLKVNKLVVDEFVNNGQASTTDSGWIMINTASGVTNSNSWPSRIRKIDKLVYFDFRFTNVTSDNTTIATIPTGYRPSRIMYFWGTMGASGGYPIRFSIDTDGTVTVLGTKAFTVSYTSSSLFALSGNYIVAD